MNQSLLKELKEKIKLQSVNSLSNMYAEDICKLANIEKANIQSVIDYLEEERVLSYRYRIKCECGEICSAFQHKLKIDQYINCNLCGRKYDMDYIWDNSEVLYELDKEGILELEEGSVELRKNALRKTKVVPIDKQIITERMQNESMEVFMGSSSEAKDFMDEIAILIEELGERTLPWSSSGKGIFAPGENTIDALIKITKRVQAAVFIFSADDQIWNDTSSIQDCNAVRDNVLFEYGLFVGALGKENVCFICKEKDGRKPKEVSDLKGVTYISGDSGTSTIKGKLKDWFGNIKDQ